MTLSEFVQLFAAEFEETPAGQFAPDTVFKDLEEWGSLVALSVIAIVDEKMDKRITGADIRSADTIEDLFSLANAK
jgi:acyl carrier protein